MTLLVVHLVRWHNGPGPLERFLDSYGAHRAGVDHQFLLVLKGFPSHSDARACVDSVQRRTPGTRHIVIPDTGLDLTAYARAVEAVRADRYCFLNSFSRVLCDGWLAHLSAALDQPDIALAGATGSWNSHRDYRRYQLGLPSGYDNVLGDREGTRLALLALRRRREPEKRDYGRYAFKARALIDLLRDRDRFERFPSPHLRTNAFIADRELMLAVGVPQIRNKRDAYGLESGPASLTRRVQALGGRVVVVARDGSTYEPDLWHESLTFWQAVQENLLVADNQSDDYENADAEHRRLLAALAWGANARPG